MNATDTDEITAYVEAVRAALAGLPEATREELLEDLPEHLAEVVADDVGTLTERLGPPSVYAAELLASAGYVGGGFPDPPPPPRKRPLTDLRDAWARRLRAVDQKAGPVFGYARASEFLVLLRPAWWVLRGYLVAMVLANVLGANVGLLPRVGNSDIMALLLLIGCILPSIWFGRRGFKLTSGARLALGAGSAVLVMVALAGFLSVDSAQRWGNYDDVSYSDPYSNVQDVFVYDSEGKLIEGARLFDQDGQPIHLGYQHCQSTEGGVPVLSGETVYPYCPQFAPFKAPSRPAVPAAPAASSVPGK